MKWYADRVWCQQGDIGEKTDNSLDVRCPVGRLCRVARGRSFMGPGVRYPILSYPILFQLNQEIQITIRDSVTATAVAHTPSNEWCNCFASCLHAMLTKFVVRRW